MAVASGGGGAAVGEIFSIDLPNEPMPRPRRHPLATDLVASPRCGTCLYDIAKTFPRNSPTILTGSSAVAFSRSAFCFSAAAVAVASSG